MKIINGSNSILFIDKLNDADFKILINDREVLKSDVLKMTYPKQIQQKFNEFLDIVEDSKIILTGVSTSKNSPTCSELDRIIDSELFFTDSVEAVWLFTDGKNPIEVQKWK